MEKIALLNPFLDEIIRKTLLCSCTLEFESLNVFPYLNFSAFWDVKIDGIAQLIRDLRNESLTSWQKLLYLILFETRLSGKPCCVVAILEFYCLNVFSTSTSQHFGCKTRWDSPVDKRSSQCKPRPLAKIALLILF